jgi:hypothetical protein
MHAAFILLLKTWHIPREISKSKKRSQVVFLTMLQFPFPQSMSIPKSHVFSIVKEKKQSTKKASE